MAAGLLLLWLLGPAPAAAMTPAAPLPIEALDRITRLGDDWPGRALAELDALPATADATQRRARALARAEIAARSLADTAATGARAAAVAAARDVDAALAEADGQYLDALRAERSGSAIGNAARAARAALAGYEAHCAGQQPAQAACEYRPRWRMQQLLGAIARRQRAAMAGDDEHALAALALAHAAADAWRQSWIEAWMADAAAQRNDLASADAHLERARQLAWRSGDPMALARVTMTEGNLAMMRRDGAAARDAMTRALADARHTGAARLESSVLINLSNLAVLFARPADALRAADEGLPIARRLFDRHAEQLLLHNGMLARTALGRIDEAWRSFDQLQAAWGEDGNPGMQVTAMREFGDALAAAGDVKGAIDMHHREQALAARLQAANRDTALAELRQRDGHEAQLHAITLLERDNAVKAAELANQGLTRRLWALGGGALALTLAVLLLLARRVSDTNRTLEDGALKLRLQSQRDALTGLANRRQVQAQLQRRNTNTVGYRGALLMIDIDHFKRINDDHGHAAGDAVLVELARRLAGAVRAMDVVARWGGEEFLILAPAAAADEIEALARRLMQAVAGTPVVLGNGWPLQVTVSIGHALFPLPPAGLPLSPEQAIHLADMALYSAKRQGRNRAVGIARAALPDAPALAALEADFERACAEGRIDLQVVAGPALVLA